jgi:hypothetical protein
MTQSDFNYDDETRDTVHGLREAAAGVWSQACQLFGPPDELTRRGFVSGNTHRLMIDWVRSLELLVRRIIIIMALNLQLAPTSSRGASSHSLATRPFAPAVTTFRVTRRASSGGRHADPATHDHPPPALDQPVRVQAMARRMEALRRAIWHSRRYAQRFARHLARIAAHNDAGGELHLIHVRPWAIHSSRLTSGQFAVNESMITATELARRLTDAFSDRWIEPG